MKQQVPFLNLHYWKEYQFRSPVVIKSIPNFQDDGKMGLDFRYDAELDKLTDEKPEKQAITESASQVVAHPAVNRSANTEAISIINSPTSPSTQDLTQKIALVKEVWEREMPGYENR